MATATEATPRSRSGVAEITCPSCGDTRTIAARSARRIRAEGGTASCRLCRTRARIRIAPEDRAWAQAVWSRWTARARAEVTMALAPRMED